MGWLSNLLHAGGTGGLNWHAHAWQSRARWQPTTEAIAQFLQSTQPSSMHLLLLGGSAGWMMPSAWLQRFARIDAYDIDPFAPWLFRQLHGRALDQSGTVVHHHRRDALIELDTILSEHPKACIWFDNMLGQHRYRVRDEVRTERELQALQHRLSGRHWGSVHDVYSGSSRLSLDATRFQTLQHKQVRAEQVDDAYLQALLQKSQAQGVWNDHCTTVVFPPGTSTWLMPWEFRPGYWHWLQAGWVTPSMSPALKNP